MATIETNYYKQAVGADTVRNAAQYGPTFQRDLRYTVFEMTLLTGAITANDLYILGAAPQDVEIIPNASYMVGVEGNVSGAFTLQKTPSKGGTPVALGGNVTLATDGTAVAVGAASGAAGLPSVSAGEFYQLKIATATALAADQKIKIVIATLPKTSVL